MTGRLVVIACGAAKLDRPAAAADMYLGQHFRLALQTALSLADRQDVRILSALYGLLRLDSWILPYDLTLGDPAAMGADQLRRQAIESGDIGRPVLALCPLRYAKLLQAVFSEVDHPLAGLGIGYQRQVLARMRDHVPAR